MNAIRFKIFTIVQLTCACAFAGDRIKAIQFDKSKVETVYVSPGLATLMIFPCEINEAIIGQEQGMKALVSVTNKKQVTIFTGSNSSPSTNLIVRCGGKVDPFVFDVVVNRAHHQDVLKVTSSFSGPSADESGMILIDSSQKSETKAKSKKTVIEISPPVLIEESKP